ncbi:hypothetical protein ACMZ5F_30580 [Streptomyces rhizosphaericola]|uniref:hypothetical protein n=1 Tax=Streptomyces rhizosphaericola TaxID=2564098 RepID=UPI0039F027E6
MSKKLSDLIQWGSLLIGITGVSLDKLLRDHPLASNVSMGIAIASFVIYASMQIFRRDANRFRGKKRVDLAWGAMLTRADHSVDVFAGDVSWALSNQNSLADRTQAGVRIRVLCRWPSTPRLAEQVRALNAAGVQVRYYTDDLVKLRGMVVDARAGVATGTALTVTKLPKQTISVGQGQSGDDSLFDYEALRYLPGADATHIATLHQLFESAWNGLPQGMIMDRATLTKGRYRTLLSRIPHYRGIGVDDIEVKKVSIASLWSCCRTVKAARLPRIAFLLEGYRRFGVEPFEPCTLESDGRAHTVLPPIVEQQPDGKFVVVDGMHRIYQLATQTDAQQVTCLVLKNAGDLPSDPIPFREVRTSPTKLPRVDNFPSYNHENFRDIKAIDRHLAAVH